MSLSNLAKTFALLALSLIAVQSIKAQPLQYNKMFHPQSKENIALMKNSPEKTVINFSKDPKTLSYDSANYINTVKKYDDEGRIIYSENYLTSSLIKYKYDKKGRVTEYYEELGEIKPQLHFVVEYTRKGAIKAVTSISLSKRAQSISYNSKTRTLLITDAGGYSYRYTLNKDNQLEKVNCKYYMKTTYDAVLTYDKNDLLVEEKGMREAGSEMLTFTKTQEYENSLLKKTIEESKTQSGSPATINTNYTYANGVLTEQSTVVMGTEMVYRYENDEKNRPLQTSYFERGEMLAQVFYVYR